MRIDSRGAARFRAFLRRTDEEACGILRKVRNGKITGAHERFRRAGTPGEGSRSGQIGRLFLPILRKEGKQNGYIKKRRSRLCT